MGSSPQEMRFHEGEMAAKRSKKEVLDLTVAMLVILGPHCSRTPTGFGPISEIRTKIRTKPLQPPLQGKIRTWEIRT